MNTSGIYIAKISHRELIVALGKNAVSLSHGS
jgi:hypothetical protein